MHFARDITFAVLGLAAVAVALPATPTMPTKRGEARVTADPIFYTPSRMYYFYIAVILLMPISHH